VAVELLLIAVVVYLVIRFLRGTRGARMLRGTVVMLIGLYLVVRLVADRFGLERVSFLYGVFLQFAFTAIIVVFAPELRRGLMRLGETRLFKSWSRDMTEHIEELVDSAVYLSKRRIGALIAIEREVGLGGLVESGTRLNAEISAPLLNTIFWPNSPLHDLGVIVSNGRISHAGVQFPLAESGELEQELGSRHRAAVGMSQESDAVVIVVSEETGDISVADRGRLIRKLAPDALRRILTAALGRTTGQERLEKPAAAGGVE
jgi:diadenylate cyclase